MHSKTFNFSGYEKILTNTKSIYHMDFTRMLCADVHSHNDVFEAFYVKFGECTVEVKSTQYQLHMNDLLIVPPNTAHRTYAFSEDAVVPCMPFRLVKNEKSDAFLSMVSPCMKILASPLFASLMDYTNTNRKITQYYKERDELIDKLIFSEIITMVIEKTEIAAKYENTKIKSYLDIIDSFFSNPDNYTLSAQDLADSMHISARHLNRILIDYLGDSFVNIMRKRRINLAQWMLRNTNTSIEEIYEKIGYTSKSAFFKVFKESIGVTPKQYRDALLSFKNNKHRT